MMELLEVIQCFQRWLYLPDSAAVLVSLATIAANRMNGDPLWLMLVAPPGGGKTEILNSLCGLAEVHPASVLTESSLLSGTPKRDKAADAKGGLLRQIGERGVILCKDFGSILSMNRDTRASVLAALREIFDGSWTRHVGTEGGRKLEWSGKIGILAGVTEAIDRHSSVNSSLGERYLMLRLQKTNDEEIAYRAMSHSGRESKMREELAHAVSSFFKTVKLPAEPSPLTEREKRKLARLATFVAQCRSAVEREGYSHEIVLVPESETPTRLAESLARLFRGLIAIGVGDSEAWDLVERVALDSMPKIRRIILSALGNLGEQVITSDVANEVDYPTSTARRALEDLATHGQVKRVRGEPGKSDRWTLSGLAVEYMGSVSQMSEDTSLLPL